MLSIGPFSATVVIVALALVAAAGAGALSARRQATSGVTRKLLALVCDSALIGVLAARVGFILAWWPQYMADPWTIILIGDGGFLLWAGALAGSAFAIWRVRKIPALWRPLGVAMLTGWAVWVMAGAMLSLTQRAHMTMPETDLARLNGSPVQLAQLTGKPMVVNLWATWCPPCRREMPMLEAAQQEYPNVDFVFVNQQQGAAAVQDFLAKQQLQLDHVLLDNRGVMAQMVGSRALPTTLFYSADGRLIDTHVGMLTAASLAASLHNTHLTTQD